MTLPNPDPTAVEIDFSALDAIPPDFTTSDGGVAWERFVEWFEKPNEISAELRKFSEDWWGLYYSIGDSWFSSLPKVLRYQWLNRYKSRISESELGRASVAAFCATHYAHYLDDKDPSRLEWIQKAEVYRNQCLTLFATDVAPMDVVVGAAVDLRAATLEASGTVAGNLFFDAAAAVIKTSGMSTLVNLATLEGVDFLAMRLYVYSDVFLSMSTFARTPLFHLINATPPSSYTPTSDGFTAAALRVHLGVSAEVLIAFSDITALINKRDILTTAELDEESSKIWKYIGTLESRVSVGLGLTSVELLSDLAAQEIWSQALIIYYYSSLRRYGPLSSTIQAALRQILLLADSINHDESPWTSFHIKLSLACPWFLAATVAVTPESRQSCLDGIQSCGDGIVHRDNARAVKRVWEVTDETGIPPDWRELVMKEGIPVGFM
ncbi:Zn(2)-C6 fungal-type transcription factor [Pseudohyphozyma bogoriensis]|nr:Zn(2)-C6 fungal-type transcription factor [Pseudohyphozyma bogoriensis]